MKGWRRCRRAPSRIPLPDHCSCQRPDRGTSPKGGTHEMKSSEIKVSSRAFAVTRCRTRTTTRVYTSAEKKRKKRGLYLARSFHLWNVCIPFSLSQGNCCIGQKFLIRWLSYWECQRQIEMSPNCKKRAESLTLFFFDMTECNVLIKKNVEISNYGTIF